MHVFTPSLRTLLEHLVNILRTLFEHRPEHFRNTLRTTSFLFRNTEQYKTYSIHCLQEYLFWREKSHDGILVISGISIVAEEPLL